LVEPEVVATSPNRIKSPVPVCCGFDSLKRCSRQGLHLHGRRSQRRVSALGLRERTKWILQPVMLRQDRFTKAIRRLLHGGEEGSCRCVEVYFHANKPCLAGFI